MDLNYIRNLVKGKITEVIFEEMFRTSGEFEIIPIGYEHTTPVLAQYQQHFEIKQVLDNIRNAPDFALISQDKSKVFLVEVKYREEIINKDLINIAKDTIQRYNPCFIFLASKSNFYFDSCNNIINNNSIHLLKNNWIDKNIQERFGKLLVEFI